MMGHLFDSPGTGPTGRSGEWYTAHCDGGSRGNPGPAGYGAVIEDAQGRVVARLSEFLGKQTNNFAEYAGLKAVLAWALEQGQKRLRVVSDSELMVKQMKGQYKVASPGLRPLWEEARRLAAKLDAFEISHTLRGGNKEADRLANEAMDRGMGKPVGGVAGSSGPAAQALPGQGGSGRSAAFSPDSSAARPRHAPAPPVRGERQVLEGYVKNGVVHILEGELPEGIFVKVIKE